jgi:hypothetical protein
VKLRSLIYAAKTVIDKGAWRSNTKMPKSAFPLSKSGLKITAKYSWCVLRFGALGEHFRVLIYHRLDLEQYHALLAREHHGDMLVMARLEFHGTHPGWHCHSACDSAGKVSGRTGTPDRRIPLKSGSAKQSKFGIGSDRAAYDKAVKFFRLHKLPPPPLFDQSAT